MLYMNAARAFEQNGIARLRDSAKSLSSLGGVFKKVRGVARHSRFPSRFS